MNGQKEMITGMGVSMCLGLVLAVFLTGSIIAPERAVAQNQEEQHAIAEAQRLTSAGLSLNKAGKYSEAEPLLVQALAINEEIFGPEHQEVAASLYHLAEVYREQSQYNRTEPLYLRALAIEKKTLGPEHPEVADTLNNLASLYEDQGRSPACGGRCKEEFDGIR